MNVVLVVVLSLCALAPTALTPSLQGNACSNQCKTHTSNTLSGSNITVVVQPTTGDGTCTGTWPTCTETNGCKLEGTLTLRNDQVNPPASRWYTHGTTQGRTELPSGSTLTTTWDVGTKQQCVGGDSDQWYFYDAATGGNFLGAYRITCSQCPSGPL